MCLSNTQNKKALNKPSYLRFRSFSEGSLGVEDSFSNHFGLTYAWISENKGLVDGKVERTKALIEK